jgi:hypothetical protein
VLDGDVWEILHFPLDIDRILVSVVCPKGLCGTELSVLMGCVPNN